MSESLEQFLFAGNLGLSPSILEVQGHSRLSMLTFLKSSSPLLVMISSMSVPFVTVYTLHKPIAVK